MSSYYIDYENVHNEGLGGIEKLGAGSRVCLFYSCKADTLKIDVVRQLMGCAAEIRFEKIDTGVENALDFQLITALQRMRAIISSARTRAMMLLLRWLPSRDGIISIAAVILTVPSSISPGWGLMRATRRLL